MDAPTELLQDEDGAIATEYVVVLILIGIAGIAGWLEWRETVSSKAANDYQSFGYPT